jgi:hypothetical protein
MIKLCRNCRAVDTQQDFIWGTCDACARSFLWGGLSGIGVLVLGWIVSSVTR